MEQGVSFTYGDVEAPVFSDVSWELEPRLMIALASNGPGGKATMMKLLARTLIPSKGFLYRCYPPLNLTLRQYISATTHHRMRRLRAAMGWWLGRDSRRAVGMVLQLGQCWRSVGHRPGLPSLRQQNSLRCRGYRS